MADREIDVDALARAYRRLVLWFGAQLLLNIGSFALQGFAQESAAGVILGLLILLGMLTTVVALAYFGFRTAQALGSGVAWLWGVAMFLPCANVVSLLVLSSKATNACAARGIPVGLLGPRLGKPATKQQAG